MNKAERLPLKKVIYFSWVVLAALWLGSWLLFDLKIAWAVLTGGLLANVSFLLLKRDLTRLLQGELAAVKARFFIKYYARLTVIAIVLFLIIKYQTVHIFGLLTGLSTIFISIAAVAISSAGKDLNIKEAS
jgi:hypothetical protein